MIGRGRWQKRGSRPKLPLRGMTDTNFYMIFAKLFNLSNDRQVLITIDNMATIGDFETIQRTNINTVDVQVSQKADSLEQAKKWLSVYSATNAEAFWVQMKMEVDAAEGTFYNLHKTICKN